MTNPCVSRQACLRFIAVCRLMHQQENAHESGKQENAYENDEDLHRYVTLYIYYGCISIRLSDCSIVNTCVCLPYECLPSNLSLLFLHFCLNLILTHYHQLAYPNFSPSIIPIYITHNIPTYLHTHTHTLPTHLHTYLLHTYTHIHTYTHTNLNTGTAWTMT